MSKPSLPNLFLNYDHAALAAMVEDVLDKCQELLNPALERKQLVEGIRWIEDRIDDGADEEDDDSDEDDEDEDEDEDE